MKKLIVVVLLALALCTAGAFADHPKGWGLGIVGQYGDYWTEGDDNLGGAALSLKIPSVPLFLGVVLNFPEDGFGIGATGDYYLIDKTLVKEAGLGFFFGIGGYFSFARHTYKSLLKDYAKNALGLGVRAPIGLSWQPVKFLELFIDFAPSLGVLFYSGNYYDNILWKDEDKIDVGGGWQGDLGLRFWF
jgi:opacity protein-like surface antigen